MFTTPTRNHISIIVERLGAVLLVFVALIYNIISQNTTDIFTRRYWHELLKQASGLDGLRALLLSVVPLLIILASLVISLFRWRKTFFHINGNEFIFEKRTMFSKESKLPIANIATVNVEQNVFERLLGTAKVKLDLNSSLTADRTDFIFVLKLDKANLLKDELTRIKKGVTSEAAAESSFTQQQADTADAEKIADFSFAHSVRQSVLSFPFMQIILTLFVFFGMPFMTGKGEQGASFVAVLTLLGVLGKSVLSAINYADYKSSMDGKNIYISCGLLKKRNYAFERSKINAVIVHQPLLARIFGMSFVSLAVVGLGNEKNENIYLSLALPKAETEKILSNCVSDFGCTGEHIPSPRAQLFYGLFGAALFTVLSLILPLAGLKYGWAFCAAVLVLALLEAVLAYKVKSFSADEDVLSFSNGVFNKKTVFFKYGDIQSVGISSNLLMKKLGVSRMTVSILSSAKLKTHKSGWFATSLFDTAAERTIAHRDKVSAMLKK